MDNNILAIDTAGSRCSVCLHAAGTAFFLQEEIANNHSRYLLPMIEQLMSDAKLHPAELCLLAWSAGPGSFTGLRIGASVIQALAYAHGLPVVSLSSLEVIAHAALETAKGDDVYGEIAVAVDARMQAAYWARFSSTRGSLSRLVDDRLVRLDVLATIGQGLPSDTLYVGDAWNLVEQKGESSQHCKDSSYSATARDVLALALQKSADCWISSASDCVPFYIHEGQSWQKRTRRSAS